MPLRRSQVLTAVSVGGSSYRRFITWSSRRAPRSRRTSGSILFNSIIVPYVRVSTKPQSIRYFGDPEIEFGIAGKRWHARADSGNGSGSFMLTKETADYLEIKNGRELRRLELVSDCDNYRFGRSLGHSS